MDLLVMFTSTANIEKRLSQASFLLEDKVELNSITRRRLKFDLPMEAIISDVNTRKYVDKFTCSYHIIIDDEGNPLQSEISFKGSGRAYLVLSVKVEQSGTSHYKVYGDRLVQIYSEYNGVITTSLSPDYGFSGGHELTVL